MHIQPKSRFQPGRRGLISILAIAALAPTAVVRGGVAYDSITAYSPPPTQVFVNNPQHGDDVTLDPGAGLTLTRVELLTRLRSAALFPEFSGTLTVRLFDKAGALPGAMFAEASIPLAITRGTDVVASVDFAAQTPLLLTDRTFVIGWTFDMPGQFEPYRDVWVRQNAAPPTVGTTDNRYYSSTITGSGGGGGVTGTWFSTTDGGRNYAIRVTTIPAPSAAALLGIPALLRRRASRSDRPDHPTHPTSTPDRSILTRRHGQPTRHEASDASLDAPRPGGCGGLQHQLGCARGPFPGRHTQDSWSDSR